MITTEAIDHNEINRKLKICGCGMPSHTHARVADYRESAYINLCEECFNNLVSGNFVVVSGEGEDDESPG